MQGILVGISHVSWTNARHPKYVASVGFVGPIGDKNDTIDFMEAQESGAKALLDPLTKVEPSEPGTAIEIIRDNGGNETLYQR